MVLQCLRHNNQRRFMRAVTSVRIYNVSTKNVKLRLYVVTIISVVLILICGAYGGTQGHTIGRNVVEIWEIKHHRSLNHEWIVVNAFTGFYIMLMAISGMGVGGFIAFLVAKRHHLYASYVNFQGEEQYVPHEDLRENLRAFTAVCVIVGIVTAPTIYFGLSSFVNFITG